MADPTLLETFPNPHPQQDYLVVHHVHEFTSLCPRTGQPDFATIRIRYVPGPRCVELKSLKLYLQGFRSKGIFYEDVTNVLLDALARVCEPRWMNVRTSWSIRGGIHTVVEAQTGNTAVVHPLLRGFDQDEESGSYTP